MMFEKLKESLLVSVFLFVGMWPEITIVLMLAASGALYHWSY